MERKPSGTSMPSVNIRGSGHRSGISKSSKESNTTVSVLYDRAPDHYVAHKSYFPTWLSVCQRAVLDARPGNI